MHAFPHRSANTIKLVDVSDFKELAATVIEEEHGAALQHLQFTRDGSILSASSTSGCLYVERDPLEEIERAVIGKGVEGERVGGRGCVMALFHVPVRHCPYSSTCMFPYMAAQANA